MTLDEVLRLRIDSRIKMLFKSKLRDLSVKLTFKYQEPVMLEFSSVMRAAIENMLRMEAEELAEWIRKGFRAVEEEDIYHGR